MTTSQRNCSGVLHREQKRELRIEYGERFKNWKLEDPLYHYIFHLLDIKKKLLEQEVLYSCDKSGNYKHTTMDKIHDLRGYVRGSEEFAKTIEVEINYSSREMAKEIKKREEGA